MLFHYYVSMRHKHQNYIRVRDKHLVTTVQSLFYDLRNIMS